MEEIKKPHLKELAEALNNCESREPMTYFDNRDPFNRKWVGVKFINGKRMEKSFDKLESARDYAFN